MQIRSFRGSGEPAWVIAPSSASKRLGPDPRRALGPAATPAASTGRTRDRTRPMLQKRQKVLAKAPSTRDPARGGYARTAGPVSTHSHFRDGILRGELNYYGDFRFCHKADIQATR